MVKKEDSADKVHLEEVHDRFINRRRMAWVSLLSIIWVTHLACFVIGVERVKVLSDLLSWFFTAMAALVGTYMGVASWENLKFGVDRWRRNGSVEKKDEDGKQKGL